MEKVNGKLDNNNATLIYVDSEDPNKVNLVCSAEFTKRACVIAGLVGIASTLVAMSYYQLLKQLKTDSKRK